MSSGIPGSECNATFLYWVLTGILLGYQLTLTALESDSGDPAKIMQYKFQSPYSSKTSQPPQKAFAYLLTCLYQILSQFLLWTTCRANKKCNSRNRICTAVRMVWSSGRSGAHKKATALTASPSCGKIFDNGLLVSSSQILTWSKKSPKSTNKNKISDHTLDVDTFLTSTRKSGRFLHHPI